METQAVLKAGIDGGNVLEIGSGPGYFGLEWLSHTKDGQLTGLEISENMIEISRRNAAAYALEKRAVYVGGNALEMPFEDETFDAVISNGSLHEWEDPVRVINEMFRVLKNGGYVFVSDLKRNICFPVRWMMKMGTRLPSIKAGLITSMNAAYTVDEIREIIKQTAFGTGDVKANPFWINYFV